MSDSFQVSDAFKEFCKEFSPSTKAKISAVLRDPDFVEGFSRRTQDESIKKRSELLLAGMAMWEEEIRPTLVEGGVGEKQAEPTLVIEHEKIVSLLKGGFSKVDELSNDLARIVGYVQPLQKKIDTLTQKVTTLEKYVRDTLPVNDRAMHNVLDVLVEKTSFTYDVLTSGVKAEKLKEERRMAGEEVADLPTVLQAVRDTGSRVIREVVAVSPEVNVDFGSLERKISDLSETISAQQKAAAERAEQQKAAAEVRKAEQAAARLAREAAAAEKKAAKKERQHQAAAARAAAKARKEQVRAAKKRGENPYTPEEQEAFRKKLEAKGKTYYTPEQRAAFKAESGKSESSKKASKPFRFYTDAQKAAFIEENFTKKGRTYYTKEQRRVFKEKSLKASKAKAKDAKDAASGV